MKRGAAFAFHGNLCALAAVAVAMVLAPTSTFSRVETVAAATAVQGADDEALRMRVQRALHDDRYFYDGHVTVSVENGNVVLRGFVLSEWDLNTGLRIARKAAAGRRVVDYLSIKLGGAR